MTSDSEQSRNTKHRGSFPNTRWSLVIAAGNDSEEARQALASLCEAYWHPIYAFLRRKYSEADAKDLTQGFFVGVLQRDDFGKLDTAQGKFRTYLLTALRHYLANRWRHDSAKRRGSGIQPLSIDFALDENLRGLEPAHDITPEKLYESRFANTVLQRAMERVRGSYRRRRKEDLLNDLLPFLVPNARTHSYQEVADKLGCTPNTARKTVFDIRQTLKDCFRLEVLEIVVSPTEIEEEISYLITVIGSAWPFGALDQV